MNELRRKDRAMPQEKAIALLERSEYGVLSTTSENGKPYGVPVHFCVIDHCIFFHCALEGEKLENIKYNTFVSFCVVGNTEVLSRKFSTVYKSVVVAGEIEEVFDINKQMALEGLINKYSPEYTEVGIKYINSLKKKARVFKIRINKLTGKERKK